MIYPLLAALQLLVQLKYIHLASAAPRAHSHWRLRLVILIMGGGARSSSLMALPMVIEGRAYHHEVEHQEHQVELHRLVHLAQTTTHTPWRGSSGLAKNGKFEKEVPLDG